MMDLTLGGPVNVGSYEGPLLDGNPIHSGSCTDSVYGCARCATAIALLEDGDALRLVEQDGRPSFSNIDEARPSCEWCQSRDSVRPYRVWDEPVVYELCLGCRTKDRRDAVAECNFDDDATDGDWGYTQSYESEDDYEAAEVAYFLAALEGYYLEPGECVHIPGARTEGEMLKTLSSLGSDHFSTNGRKHLEPYFESDGRFDDLLSIMTKRWGR